MLHSANMLSYWKGKLAVVTGAGAGIGYQIAKDLAHSGMTVIGLEKSEDKIKKILSEVEESKLRLIPIKCDVSKDNDLKEAFERTSKEFGGVDVLVNNAAVAKDGLICTGNLKDFRYIIDTNLYGIVACSRLAIKSMQTRNTRGHIININSISGHYMPPLSEPKFNVYIATKRAMTSVNEILRQELKFLGLNIKVTSVSPGVTATEIFEAAGTNVINQEFLKMYPHLKPEDVSKIVMTVLDTPENVQIHEIIVHALHELY